MDLIRLNDDTETSPRLRGLFYGDGFFTTARIKNGRVQFWDLHQKRLTESANRLFYSDFSIEQIKTAISKLPLSGALKITITRAMNERGYGIPSKQKSVCFVEIFTNNQSSYEKISEPEELFICNTPASINPILSGLKHCNRLDNVLATEEVKNTSLSDGLMLIGDKIISSTKANIFFVNEQQQFVTPKIDQAGVNGIIRQQVIKLSKQLSIRCDVRDVRLSELKQFKEVFITNSLTLIKPIRRIDKHPFSQFDMSSNLFNQLK